MKNNSFICAGARVLLAIAATLLVVELSPKAWAGGAVQFGPATNFATGNNPGAIAVGDFNHDGKPDIVVMTGAGVSLLLNLGNGVLADPTNSPALFSYGGAIAAGDFNNDGKLDIVDVSDTSSTPGGSILFGDGNGFFPARTNLSYSYYAGSVVVGDFNRDGNLDLAIGNSGYVTVALGRGDGSFGSPTNYTLNAIRANTDMRAADVYGHGRTDLVVSVNSSANSNCFCVLSNKSDGTFAVSQYFAAGGRSENHYSLEAGDFNADGNQDVAVLNYNAQSATIWINSGNGNFIPTHEYQLGFSPANIIKEDFNGDGKIDLIIRGGSVARVLLGDGDGTFTLNPQWTISTDTYNYGTSVTVGDFNSDGMPDLAIVNYTSNSVAIMLNQTPPTLQMSVLAGYNQISWLNTFGLGYSLEYTTNLATPASWQPFPYPPVLIGNQKAIADWADGGQKFYRLKKP